MSFLKKMKLNSAASRLIEEQLYEYALNELESGARREGLWAKAIASSSGDESAAKGHYLKYRVQSLHDEAEVAQGILESKPDSAILPLSRKERRAEAKQIQEQEKEDNREIALARKEARKQEQKIKDKASDKIFVYGVLGIAILMFIFS